MAKARRLVKRLAAAGLTLAMAATAWAMPTKQQLVEAQRIVKDLTADDLLDLKAKKKTAGDVAAGHLALADKAETEAGKYLLLQGAFRLYARSGDYDSAASTLQRMRSEIRDLPPEVVIEIVNNEMRRVAGSKAPKVLAIFRDAQRKVKYRKRFAAADLDATAHPESPVFVRRLAECHVGLGDWPKALPIFAKLGDAAAKFELDPVSAKDCDALKAADYWWSYKSTDPEPYKAHAAALYRTAIDTGVATGLRREMAAKRLAEIEESGLGGLNTAVSAHGASVPPSAAKAPAPTTGPWAIPANFKAPLVRTLKLADGVDMDFCAVPAGTFQMSYPWKSEKANQGKTHKVTITRPFWFSKTFVTTKQYRLFKSVPPERDTVCKDLEAKFPDFDVVHGVAGGNVDSCIEHINQKFGHLLPKGYVFRLPTEAEWEYAYGGGNGKGTKDMGQFKTREETSKILGKYDLKGNHGCRLISGTPANRWGIIGGPTDEPQPVLDRIDGRDGVTESHSTWEHYDYDEHEIDPIRIGKSRIERRGARDRWMHPNAGGLFRVVIGPDLVAEKMAAEAGKAASSPVLAPPTVYAAQNATQPAQVKTHIIKLNNTVSMEFVECPAGTFTMGFEKDEHSPLREHKVTITRPFWIAKTKLTLGQYKVFDRKFKPKDEKVLGGDAVPFVVRFFEGWPVAEPFKEQTGRYCEYLTKKFRNSIPKGYVFRLPTEAEWEYAYVAGETDPDNFYGATGDLGRLWTEDKLREYMFTSKALNEIAMKLGKKEMAGWDRTGTTVGQLKPNRWGLYDMAGNTFEMMLDTIDRNLCDAGTAWPPWGKSQTALLYEDDEIDPVKMASPDTKEDKRVNLIRGGDLGKWKKRYGFICSGVRIVVGPDLVAEKKAGKK